VQDFRDQFCDEASSRERFQRILAKSEADSQMNLLHTMQAACSSDRQTFVITDDIEVNGVCMYLYTFCFFGRFGKDQRRRPWPKLDFSITASYSLAKTKRFLVVVMRASNV
jgi:hypothetical protein